VPYGVGKRTTTGFWYSIPQIVRYSFNRSEAQRIRQPILYLVSDGLAAASTRLREQVRLWLPQTEEVLIDKADHALPLQRPEEIAKAISAFLVRHPMG